MSWRAIYTSSLYTRGQTKSLKLVGKQYPISPFLANNKRKNKEWEKENEEWVPASRIYWSRREGCTTRACHAPLFCSSRQWETLPPCILGLYCTFPNLSNTYSHSNVLQDFKNHNVTICICRRVFFSVSQFDKRALIFMSNVPLHRTDPFVVFCTHAWALLQCRIIA